MKYIYQFVSIFAFASMLSGCNPEMFVSQTPNIAEFSNKMPEEVYRQAEHMLKIRRYSTAIRHFRAFLALHPNHPQAEKAYLSLIKCYEIRGQLKEALKTIEIFITHYPHSRLCDTLKKKQEFLKRKEKRDHFYHLVWLQDIKQKNKKSYHGLVQRFDKTISSRH